MNKTLRAEHFGPYKVIRLLGSTRGVSRFVVLCTKTDTNRLLYRFPNLSHHQQRRNLFDAMVTMSTLDHPHLLRIESASYDDRGRLCVITPYTGNHDGLVTLTDLIAQRGKLGVIEASRAIEHLLAASVYANASQISHGPVSPDHVLVDRYGSIQVELYAYPALGQREPQNTNALIADEIRSIVEIAYTLITGLSVSADRLSPSRLFKRLDRNWDAWFDIGLDPIDGFEDAQHALNALPTHEGCEDWLTSRSPKRSQAHLSAMIRRFRAAPATSSRRTR
jgi:hypothetical protein